MMVLHFKHFVLKKHFFLLYSVISTLVAVKICLKFYLNCTKLYIMEVHGYFDDKSWKSRRLLEYKVTLNLRRSVSRRLMSLLLACLLKLKRDFVKFYLCHLP